MPADEPTRPIPVILLYTQAVLHVPQARSQSVQQARGVQTRPVWFVGCVNTVPKYSIWTAAPVLKRLAAVSRLGVKSQRSMLSCHFAIYNKLYNIRPLL